MESNKRELKRFPVNLAISEIDARGLHGEVKDFSRKGMKAVFDDCSPKEKSEVSLTIQRPDYNDQIPARAYVVWKKPLGEKCEVGLRFKDFPRQAKADILDLGYKAWLKNIFPERQIPKN